MFARNVGPTDRVVRLAAGLVMLLIALVVLDGIAARLALGVTGAALAATGAISRCSVYYVLGYSTCPVRAAAPGGQRPSPSSTPSATP